MIQHTQAHTHISLKIRSSRLALEDSCVLDLQNTEREWLSSPIEAKKAFQVVLWLSVVVFHRDSSLRLCTEIPRRVRCPQHHSLGAGSHARRLYVDASLFQHSSLDKKTVQWRLTISNNCCETKRWSFRCRRNEVWTVFILRWFCGPLRIGTDLKSHFSPCLIHCLSVPGYPRFMSSQVLW